MQSFHHKKISFHKCCRIRVPRSHEVPWCINPTVCYIGKILHEKFPKQNHPRNIETKSRVVVVVQKGVDNWDNVRRSRFKNFEKRVADPVSSMFEIPL